jgi:ATP-dependent 26S proteasome regulatory subunit
VYCLDIEKIDKALLIPGRIDLIVEFKNLRKCDINSLFKLWYGENISNKDLENIKDYVISQAEFGKLCFENMDNPKSVIKELQKLYIII